MALGNLTILANVSGGSDGAWSRKSSSVDISPLVACTVALWGLKNAKTNRPRIVNLADIDLEQE